MSTKSERLDHQEEIEKYKKGFDDLKKQYEQMTQQMRVKRKQLENGALKEDESELCKEIKKEPWLG